MSSRTSRPEDGLLANEEESIYGPWPLRVPDERASFGACTFVVPSKSCHAWIIQALDIDFPPFAQVNFRKPE